MRFYVIPIFWLQEKLDEYKAQRLSLGLTIEEPEPVKEVPPVFTPPVPKYMVKYETDNSPMCYQTRPSHTHPLHGAQVLL